MSVPTLHFPPSLKRLPAIVLLTLLGLWQGVAHAGWTAMANQAGQGSVAVAGHPGLLVQAANARIAVLATSDPAGVVVVNPDTGKVLATIPLTGKVRNLVVDETGRNAYALLDVSDAADAAESGDGTATPAANLAAIAWSTQHGRAQSLLRRMFSETGTASQG